MTLERRIIRPGEIFAISPDVVQEERGAFFFMVEPSAKENQRIGDIAIVTVEGPLVHHGGCGDSYEAIVDRVDKAMTGEGDEGPPKRVVLKIDSPGGAVAGIGSAVRKMRKMQRDRGIWIDAFVNESAYSAGLWICCACREVVVPPSGCVGSIGVFATMVDQTKLDAAMGLKFTMISSGKRKLDGNPHVPTSAEAVREEVPRVAAMADAFFKAVSIGRGVSTKTVQSWEGRRFLATEARKLGLVDAVLDWDSFFATISKVGQPVARSTTVVSASPGPESSSAEATAMPIAIDALIDKVEAKMAKTTDPAKLLALATRLDAYKKTKHSIEKHETEEGEDDEDEDEKEDDEKDDEKDDDEDEEAAAARIVYDAAVKLTGRRGADAVLAGLNAKVDAGKDTSARLQAIEADRAEEQKGKLIERGQREGRFGPALAAKLATKPLAYVQDYVATLPKGTIQYVDEPEARQAVPQIKAGALPPDIQRNLDEHIRQAAAAGIKLTADQVLANLNALGDTTALLASLPSEVR